MKRFFSLFLASAVFLLPVGLAISASPDDVPRMAKEQLKPLLGNPEIVVLDVRAAPEYNDSKEKIKGAVRAAPRNVKVITGRYAKNKTLVLYCS